MFMGHGWAKVPTATCPPGSGSRHCFRLVFCRGRLGWLGSFYPTNPYTHELLLKLLAGKCLVSRSAGTTRPPTLKETVGAACPPGPDPVKESTQETQSSSLLCWPQNLSRTR